MTRWNYALRMSFCALVASCGAAQTGSAQLVFTDVTGTAGIGLTDDLTESVAWGDYDGDGDLDIYLTLDGKNRLLRNNGGDSFTDVTDLAGVGNLGWSVGAAFGDLDNDGDLDLYVVNFGEAADALYRNEGPGHGALMTDVSVAAGVTIDRSSRGMAFVDYDRDGLLDIYVMAIGENLLYRNLGNLTFENVATGLGVDAPHTGVGVVCTDVDQNGWMDIYTGNRSGVISSLYMNTAGIFTDVATEAGIDAAGLGMGVLSFDYDNDLDFDLYWTTWPGGGLTPEPNRLYENIDGETFVDVAVASGTTDDLGWGISCNAGDIDNDGWQDFFVTNGFSDDTTPNVLFRNKGQKNFEDVTSTLGGAAFDGRGVAFADYDDDGDLDLLVTADAGESNRLWRNDTDNGHHWLTLDLVGTVSNRSAIGARVEVTTPLTTLVQEVSGGAGRGSQNSLPVEFGLALAESVDEVSIQWPSGRIQTLSGPEIDVLLTVIEPLRGDFDEDGDLDELDHLALIDCLSGPDAAPEPTPPTTAAECLGVFNYDQDADLDLDDFAAFTIDFTGG